MNTKNIISITIGIAISLLCAMTFAANRKLPNFKQISSFNQRRTAFISYMLPLTKTANTNILRNRNEILQLYSKWQKFHALSSYQVNWLKNIATRYKLPHWNKTSQSSWIKLLKRVDIVPNSMVIAQAANETAWGTSRFAQQGKNLFGQWCYVRNCGIVPRRRPKGAHYEVRKFPTTEASIRSYLLNLNTNKAYHLFRNLRYRLRQDNTKLTGKELAAGLVNYSQRRHVYVHSIRRIISKNDLAQYDRSGPVDETIYSRLLYDEENAATHAGM